MRIYSFGLFSVVLSSAVIAGACGSDPATSTTEGAGAGSQTPGTGGDGGGTSEPSIEGLESMRIEPEDAVLVASPGAPARQAYKVFGVISGKGESDITDRVRLGVASASLGGFQGAEFVSASDRGGLTEVVASANGGAVSAKTGLTVQLKATLLGPDEGEPLPADPARLFTGAPDAARAPELVYPNSGVVLPPNLKRLEVHYRPRAPNNELFEIAFTSATADIRTYLRCPNPVSDGCIFEIDPRGYQYIAESNRGRGPVSLRVRGASDEGGGFGESAEFEVTFAETDVNGGIYYWTTSNGSGIMRFDFGGSALTPEVFLSPEQDGFDQCVGCHALSRDGTKMVASLGGQNDGRIVYLNDLTNPDNFALKGDSDNRIQFASFNPTGSRFVAIYGDTGPELRNRLWFHDGTTGRRIAEESFDLAFEPDHPDWSPDGTMIAVTRVGVHNTSQRPLNGGIELLTLGASGWDQPRTLVPIAPGLNRYNPNFAPDSTFLLFSESTCPGGMNGTACDGDADESAKTWAIEPKVGATPILLRRAGAPGVTDGQKTDLSDTFPRFSPFQQKQGNGTLFWATISSRRKAGLRDPDGRQLLWMFAIDPAKIPAGEDASYPAFFLPFQDLGTSNHIAQWTQQIVQIPR